MTLHLIDIASYQRGINLDAVKAAGFSLVNIKTSQGVGYTFSDAVSYARGAQTRGMGISCFHWLDNTASGAAQAAYCWRTLGQVVAAVGHPVALQVDNEDSAKPATWAITRDFVHAIADRMGHLPYMYTGDWWATAGGRAGWDVHSLTPWLMAAPNAGYPGSYPGDTSGSWRAGYWGYDSLALMQYAVGTIPGAGGGNISKTAIRDPGVWASLTGSTPAAAAGKDTIMANASEIINAWNGGFPKTADGTRVLPVEWEILREKWEASVTAALNQLAAKVGAPVQITMEPGQLATLAAALAPLIVAGDNPLGEQDLPAITAGTEAALRKVLGGLDTADAAAPAGS